MPKLQKQPKGNEATPGEKIANLLFVNGEGQQAYRLVLTSSDGRDLGGWGRSVVVARINEALRKP